MKAGPYLCLTQPAERLRVMSVQLEGPPLSLCLDFLFLFISKVRMNLLQVIHICKCYCQQVASFPNNYTSHPQDSIKSFLVKSLIPKISLSERTQNVSCLWVADCKRIYHTKIISSLSLLYTTSFTTYIRIKLLIHVNLFAYSPSVPKGKFSFVFRILVFMNNKKETTVVVRSSSM